MSKKNTALGRIQQYFPHVIRVVDSTETIHVVVTKADVVKGKRKDPANCVMARACVRQRLADAAIIGLGTSYLIRGDTAIRFLTPHTVAREIVAHDRDAVFAEGADYSLGKMPKSNRLGRSHVKLGTGQPHDHGGPKPNHIHHKTSNVRIMYRKAPNQK